jgi:hypothetical protein
LANNLQKTALVATGVIIAGMVLTAGVLVAFVGFVASPIIALLRGKQIQSEPRKDQPPIDAIDVPFERLDK